MSEEEQPKRGLLGRLFGKEEDAGGEPDSPAAELGEEPVPIEVDTAKAVEIVSDNLPAEDTLSPPADDGDEPDVEERQDHIAQEGREEKRPGNSGDTTI